MARSLYRKAPETPVEELTQDIRRHLYLPDPGALYTLLGAVAGSMVEGVPVYLMLVGPPSCGGSELLALLNDIPGVVGAGLIESPAAFLSGSGKRDTAKDATGGLLKEVGVHGALVLKDFTSLLSLKQDARKLIMTVLREAYDGEWKRPVGTDGGKNLSWKGRLNCFAKVTSAIDQHMTKDNLLGERWVYYRMSPVDGFAQAKKALQHKDSIVWKEELRCLTHAMFESLDLQYGGQKQITLATRRTLSDLEMNRIITLASVAARCRSGVDRDFYTHEITGPPEREVEARLGSCLQQIYVGMELIGVDEKMRWKLIEKAALDSMPRTRRMIADRIWMEDKGEGEVSYEQLRKFIGASMTVIIRAVEDLELHEVVEVGIGSRKLARDGQEAKAKVRLSEWMKREWGQIKRAQE